MSADNGPVCDRCEEKPALFECNNCSTGDGVFFLCDACHGLIHVGKFKSHIVTSMEEKAKQTLQGCLARLEQKDSMVTPLLDQAMGNKKQLQECEIVENSEESKRVHHKFLVTDDITLLTEVVASQEAFSRPVTHKVWSEIAEKIGDANWKMKNLTPRTVKERAERIVKQHKAADSYKNRQSGTPEAYLLKDRLLEQASEQFEEAKEVKERRSKLKEEVDTVRSARSSSSSFVSLVEKRKPEEQSPLITADFRTPVAERKRVRDPLMLAEKGDITEIVAYLKERDEISEARKWEELKLEREKFEASKAEREAMLAIMNKLVEKLQPA